MRRLSGDRPRTARMSMTERLERLTPVLKPTGYLKGIARSIARRPRLIVPALVVWLLCTVAIVVAVVLSAEKTAAVEKDKARLLVSSTATVSRVSRRERLSLGGGKAFPDVSPTHTRRMGVDLSTTW